jgi:molybdopterin-binding protein
MQLSARNQLKGQVTRVKSGAVKVEVKVKAGKVAAAITDSSVKRLKLKTGDKVTVIIKATEVMIGK